MKSKAWKGCFTLAVSLGLMFLFTPITRADTSGNFFSSFSGTEAGLVDFAAAPAEKGFWLKLTVKQKKILRKAIRELKQQGGTKKEINALIDSYLARWGIERRELKGFWRKLTKEQRRELRRAIKELKAQGASREEIKALIDKYLEGWGIKRGK
jgi:DNA-binding transcriptional regulator YhcF (GntR family)